MLSIALINNAHSQKSIEVNKSDILPLHESEGDFYLATLIGIGRDEQNNIYLFDEAQSRIHKLDPEGNFIESLLRPGRGPGEVYAFSSFDVASNIIVADNQNFAIKRFDLSGEQIDQFIYHPDDMETPRNMIKIDEDKYLMLFSLSENQALRVFGGVDELFHIYNIQNEERVFSFGGRETILDELGYESDVAKSFTTLNVGDALLLEDAKLLYAPYIYNGQLFLYNVDIEGKEAEKKRVIRGRVHDISPAIDFEDNEQEQTTRDVVSSTIYGEVAGLINIRNLGIHRTSDGTIVSFYAKQHETADSFYETMHVDIFDSDLNFIGSDQIKEADPGAFLGNVDAVDELDRFYMTVRGVREHYGLRFSLSL